MKRILLATTAAMAAMTGTAMAETAVEQVIAGLQAQGFTEIEVTTGPTQVKVEASGGGQELEYVYDRLTGEILMQELGLDDDEDDEGPKVEIDTSDEDFLEDGDFEDDEDDFEDDDEDDEDDFEDEDDDEGDDEGDEDEDDFEVEDDEGDDEGDEEEDDEDDEEDDED